MLTCKEVTALVSESLDRRLPIRQRLAMRLHLTMCKLCSRYKRQLLFMRNTYRLYAKRLEDGSGSSPASLSEQSRLRLISLLGYEE
jgi:hypothetical protein